MGVSRSPAQPCGLRSLSQNRMEGLRRCRWLFSKAGSEGEEAGPGHFEVVSTAAGDSAEVLQHSGRCSCRISVERGPSKARLPRAQQREPRQSTEPSVCKAFLCET